MSNFNWLNGHSSGLHAAEQAAKHPEPMSLTLIEPLGAYAQSPMLSSSERNRI